MNCHSDLFALGTSQQLNEQNKMLQATLKSVYEKEDSVFMSRCEEGDDKEKLVQSLQDEIQQLTNDR